MTLTLHLTPALEQRLTEEVKRRGLSVDEYTLQLLDKYLPPEDLREELVALLQACAQWLQTLAARGTRVILPEASSPLKSIAMRQLL